MKKATLQRFEELGIIYHNFSRVKNKTNKNDRGWRYTLSKPLTEIQRDELLRSKNVILGSATYRYAPEIVYNTVILLDNNIKNIKEAE